MRVVIIEDEKPAAEKLAGELKVLRKDVQILKVIHDVKSAIAWLPKAPEMDLIFMDVELSDGLSFEILRKVKLSVPIIFITAYDHYWQQALTLNGIDYLLKPIELVHLEKALSKFELIKRHFSLKMEALLKYVSGQKEHLYKEKFLVRKGKELVMVPSSEIVYFKASDKVTIMLTSEDRKLIVDSSLSKLEGQLDPRKFTRANRSHLINMNFIDKMQMLPKGKIRVVMQNKEREEITIAQEKAAGFKEWVEGSRTT